MDPLPYISKADSLDEVIVPFIQNIPRGPPLPEPVSVENYLDNKSQYDRYFLETLSTASTLGDWISYHSQYTLEPDIRPLVPILALLSIIHRDTLGIVSKIEVAMSEILDELKSHIEARTRSVREFIRELQGLEERIGSFISSCLSETEMPDDFRHDFARLLRKLRVTTTRCEALQQTLRAELSSLEARRSITEAESLARLTELAFIFVPLTFAAGLFSIQVQEFQTPPPLRVFAITAVVILLLSYGLRLLQGSRRITRLLNTTRAWVIRHLDFSQHGMKLATHMGMTWDSFERRRPGIRWLIGAVGAITTAISRGKDKIFLRTLKAPQRAVVGYHIGVQAPRDLASKSAARCVRSTRRTPIELVI